MSFAPARAPRAAQLHVAALACGCGALAFKPLSYWSIGILISVGLVAWLGFTSVGMRETPFHPWVAAATGVAGILVFMAVRLTEEGFGVRLTTLGVAGILLAGVAEEAFFRGYMHAWLRRTGVGVLATAAVTTALFALIHVPTYGIWVLPIDLAAGAIFAWQREVSGTWMVPAFTHSIANLMQLG